MVRIGVNLPHGVEVGYTAGDASSPHLRPPSMTFQVHWDRDRETACSGLTSSSCFAR